MPSLKFAIIGHPLEHSMSPVIHKYAFKSLGIIAEYGKQDIPLEEFTQRIAALKAQNWRGFNVTVPYKEKIIPFLDIVSDGAKKIGAVNTIKVNSSGQWEGYNTDYTGFYTPLKNLKSEITSCLMIGAGGAAKAVAFSLLDFLKIDHLTILNRTIDKAHNLIASLKDLNDCDFQAVNQEKKLDIIYDLIVNTTSVGMGAGNNKTPFTNLSVAHKNTIVYDIIYNPTQTELLRLAKENNLQTINGAPMLIGQAADAFNIWTGKCFDKEAITKHLKANNIF